MTNDPAVYPSRPRETAQITLPDGRTFEGPVGTNLETFLKAAFPTPEVPLIAALVDGQLRELTFPIERDASVEPIDLSQSDGVRIYRRSLTFLMVVAAHHLYPGTEIYVDHSLPYGGYFCQARNHGPFVEEELDRLEQEMRRLVDADLPIIREMVPLDEALRIPWMRLSASSRHAGRAIRSPSLRGGIGSGRLTCVSTVSTATETISTVTWCQALAT